jgi:hypothetical protein
MQLESGYIKIINKVADAFCKNRLSGEEWQVLWVVLRNKATGSHKRATRVVTKELPKLVAKELHTKDNKDTYTKDIYGEFKNVLLSLDERNKLERKFGSVGTAGWIKTLDEGIELKGYKYKSHYLAILKWAGKEAVKGQIDIGGL